MPEDLQLSLADIRKLAELERQMDTGEQPYVVDTDRNRWAFPADVLNHLGMESGQQVSPALLRELMKSNLLRLQRLIETQPERSD